MIPHIQNIFDLYVQEYPRECSDLKLLEEQIRGGEDIVSRKNFQGHVTASGLVVLDDSVLLIFHNFLQKYLQPGGHVENDPTLIASAVREVHEETGVKVVPHPLLLSNGVSVPIFINSHAIPRNEKKNEPAHYHHDFMFLFSAEQNSVAIDLKEVSAYKWLSIDDVLEEGSLKSAIDKFKHLRGGI